MLRNAWIRLVAALTPSCTEVTRLISASHERRLSGWEKRQLDWHYSICKWCQRYERQLDALKCATREMGSADSSGPELSEAARDRLRRSLEEF